MIVPSAWKTGPALLAPGPPGSFDETAVKDPSVVFPEGRWHVVYTARGRGRYSMGMASAETLEGLASAPRVSLERLTGGYGCAPQLFFYRPHGLWYLVFQTDEDGLYTPVYSTCPTLDDPGAWTLHQTLLRRDEEAKWIDFWTICDEAHAYLFHTRDHHEVAVRRTQKGQFPHGWGPARVVFEGVHESVHVYRGRNEYLMFYEGRGEARSFGIARAPSLDGPWTLVGDDYATGASLRSDWTDMPSHGELLRSGFDERMEADADRPRWIIQGIRREEYVEPYAEMRWSLGLMEPADGQ